MKKYTLAIVAVASLGLYGCAEERAAPVSRPAAAKKPASVATTPTAVATSSYSYAYSPVGKRDPFRSPVSELASSGPAGGACNEPLCQWDLEQFTLVAVVTGDANPLAMVQDPQGRGYIVRRNSKMGKQGGRVGQILRDQVIVNEQYVAPDGKAVVNPVSLRIKQDDGFAAQLDFLSGRAITQ